MAFRIANNNVTSEIVSLRVTRKGARELWLIVGTNLPAFTPEIDQLATDAQALIDKLPEFAGAEILSASDR